MILIKVFKNKTVFSSFKNRLLINHNNFCKVWNQECFLYFRKPSEFVWKETEFLFPERLIFYLLYPPSPVEKYVCNPVYGVQFKKLFFTVQFLKSDFFFRSTASR